MKKEANNKSWRVVELLHSWRNSLIVVCAFIFVAITLFTTGQMASTLRDKELHDVELWVMAMEKMSRDVAVTGVPVALDMINTRQNIPFIVLDESMNVVESHLVEDNVLNHPDRLRKHIQKFSSENEPIVFQRMWSEERYLLFYGSSQLLHKLYYVPFTQFIVTFIFFMLAYLVIRSSKRGEQDRVWVGLAKETAHQLGTPISSLMGWIEYLKDQDVETEAVEEMRKDLEQLLKVTDRFSKIGSDTPLSPANINEVVDGVVRYFRHRVPRGVSIEYDGLSMAPLRANINLTLFEWVIENLMKNSLDALQGSGAITVQVRGTESNVEVDVTDTGRGIAKGAWRKIFEPGYTTKTRGWGLGLSLSRRIVEEYHGGKIGVVESTIGKGTTIRVTIKQLFD